MKFTEAQLRYFRKAREEGVPEEEIVANMERMYDTSNPSGYAGAVAKSVADAVPGMGSDSAPGAFLQKLASSGLIGPYEGVRQLWNEATGDEEEALRIAQERDARRSALEAITGDSPVSGFAGEMTALLTPAMVASKVPQLAKLPQASSAIGRTLQGGAVGAASGAGAGFVSPLSEKDMLSGGQRENNAAVGSLLGAGVGTAVPAVSSAVQAARRVLPEEMVDKIVNSLRGKYGTETTAPLREAEEAISSRYPTSSQGERMATATEDMGYVPGRQTQDLTDIRTQVGNKEAATKEYFNSKYLDVEGTKAGKIKSKEIRDAMGPFLKGLRGLTEDINSPKLSKMVDRLSEASENVSFQEVRQLQRELKSWAAKSDKQQGQKIYDVINSIDGALDNWAAGGKNRAEMLNGARALDDMYKEEYLPLVTAKSKVEGNQWKQYINDGTATQDLITRVPEAKGPLKNLFLDKASRADTKSAASKVEANSAGEILLDDLERRAISEARRPPELPPGLKKPPSEDPNWPTNYLGPYAGPQVEQLRQALPNSMEALQAVAGNRLAATAPGNQRSMLLGSGLQEIAPTELRGQIRETAEALGNDSGILNNLAKKAGGIPNRMVRGVKDPNEWKTKLLGDILRGQVSGSIVADYLSEE